MNKLKPTESTSGIIRRGLMHMAAGLSAALAGLFLPRPVFLILLGLFTASFISVELIRFRNQRLNHYFCVVLKPFLRNVERRRFTGASYLLAASLFSFLLFPETIAALAISFTALGDSAATMVGKSFGKHRIYDRKTLEGTLACLSACLITASIFHVTGLPISWAIGISGALAATLAEALPLGINDNLAIPFMSGLVMMLLPF